MIRRHLNYLHRFCPTSRKLGERRPRLEPVAATSAELQLIDLVVSAGLVDVLARRPPLARGSSAPVLRLDRRRGSAIAGGLGLVDRGGVHLGRCTSGMPGRDARRRTGA